VTITRSAIDTLLHLFRRGHVETFRREAVDLEPADLADVLAELDELERLDAVRMLPAEVSADALAELPEEAHPGETLAALDPAHAADIVEELADDDAADILGDLDPHEQERILAGIEQADRADVERLLGYQEDTAGGIMTTHLITVSDGDTADQALAAIRRQAEEAGDFYQVFIVDRDHRLVGTLPLKSLVMSPGDRPVRDFMDSPDTTVPPEMDQEDVARLMSRYNIPSLPVVNAAGRLLGRITFDDIDDVVDEEATEDLLRFGGVSAEEGLEVPWPAAVRSRLPWLFVNLLTAFLAGAVVYLFQARIQAVVVLAVLMPIIAGMGGNAGTQALAVTVRRLALGLLPRGQFLRTVVREGTVGVINGLALGLAVGLMALALGEGARLGLLVFFAMAGNVFIAGLAGAFIPMLLERVGVDPAIASSVFVTTFTDICGFTLLLGLAGLLLS